MGLDPRRVKGAAVRKGTLNSTRSSFPLINIGLDEIQQLCLVTHIINLFAYVTKNGDDEAYMYPCLYNKSPEIIQK